MDGTKFCEGVVLPQSSGLWRRRFPRRWSPRFIVVGGGTSHREMRRKIRSLEAALSVGPEKNAAKVQIQEALRRAKEVSQPVRPNPDTIQAEAVAKVERLQRALDALGDLGGPEVDAIKKALKKAQEVARERPIAELVKECKDFIERSTRRVNRLKAELESETGLLEEGRVRLARLDAQHAMPVGEKVAVRSFVHFATDGGTRFVVTRIASESCIQGEAIVWGWTSRCQCNSPNTRSPLGPRGVVESQKLRVARRTRIRFTRRDCTFVATFVARSFTVGFIASGNWGTRLRWKFTQRHGCLL